MVKCNHINEKYSVDIGETLVPILDSKSTNDIKLWHRVTAQTWLETVCNGVDDGVGMKGVTVEV